MPKNKIRHLRKSKGLTVAALAERAGLSQPHLTRIEGGSRGLSIPLAEKIASALGTEVAEVLGIQGNVGIAEAAFAEDAEPYDAKADDIVASMTRKRNNVVPYRVKSKCLDQIDIHPGDIIFIDISAEAVENTKPMQAVIAQVYSSDDLLKATTILRQFLPPNLLVTNSAADNEMPINIAYEDVHIKGVVIATHRSMKT